MAGTVVVVPARMGSTRLPGKPLADICGRPLVLRVLDGVAEAGPDVLVVATDSPEIEEVVRSAGYDAVLTGPASCGTERVYAAWEAMGRPGERIINLQGDEPFVRPDWIEALSGQDISGNQVVTLAREIPAVSGHDSSVVKVVTDSGGYALYFSRSIVPWGAESVLQHVGVYCFTPESLCFCIDSPTGGLAASEKLEQLSWLENGVKIKVVAGDWNALGVDTPEDLARVRKLFGKRLNDKTMLEKGN